jgi:hypothetical protein
MNRGATVKGNYKRDWISSDAIGEAMAFAQAFSSTFGRQVASPFFAGKAT